MSGPQPFTSNIFLIPTTGTLSTHALIQQVPIIAVPETIVGGNKDTERPPEGDVFVSNPVWAPTPLYLQPDIRKIVFTLLAAEDRTAKSGGRARAAFLTVGDLTPAASIGRTKTTAIKMKGADFDNLDYTADVNGSTSEMNKFLFDVQLGKSSSMVIGDGVTATYNREDVEYGAAGEIQQAMIILELSLPDEVDASDIPHALAWARRASAVSSAFIDQYWYKLNAITAVGHHFPAIKVILRNISLELVDQLVSFAIKSVVALAEAAYTELSRLDRIDLDSYNRVMTPALDAINDAIQFSSWISNVIKVFQRLGGGELAHSIREKGHNFNNYATSIIGYAGLFQMRLERGENISLADLRTFLLQPKTIDDAIKMTRHLYVKMAERYGVVINIENFLPPDVNEMRVGDNQMEMIEKILGNLVSNAIKYHRKSLPAGERTVTIRAKAEDNDYVILVVSDNGRGMTPEEITSYLTTEEWRSEDIVKEGIDGHGIGHRSVRRLVEQLGGTLTLLSSADIGTIAAVRINVKNLTAAQP